MDICVRFGSRVRAARLELGLSQEELAHRAESNRTYISDIERGTRNPTIEVVDRIARALSVSMGALLDAHVSAIPNSQDDQA